jgi:hypothetical protein
MSEFQSFRNYLNAVGTCIGIIASLTTLFVAPDTFWFLYVTFWLCTCTFCAALFSRIVLHSDPYESKCNAPVPACALALALPVVFAIFGEVLLPAHLLDAPFFLSAAIAIYVAGFDVRTYGIAIPKRPLDYSAVMARIDSSGSMS